MYASTSWVALDRDADLERLLAQPGVLVAQVVRVLRINALVGRKPQVLLGGHVIRELVSMSLQRRARSRGSSAKPRAQDGAAKVFDLAMMLVEDMANRLLAVWGLVVLHDR